MFGMMFYALAGRSCWCASLSVRLLGLGSHTIHGCLLMTVDFMFNTLHYWGHRDVVFCVLNTFVAFVVEMFDIVVRTIVRHAARLS